MAQTDKVVIGRIVGLHGVKGWIKIQSFTEPRQQIGDYAPWLVQGQPFKVSAVQQHGKGMIAKLADIDDRDQAAALMDLDIVIDRQQLPALADDEFYWHDLQGLRVLNKTGVELGSVEYIFETGANDVLVLRHQDQECLIPYIPGQVVQQVDLDSGVIHVDWDWDEGSDDESEP